MTTAKQYDYARESKFSNLGVDVPDSARHKRNESITLTEIEQGLIDSKLMKRDNLMKLNPIKLSDINDGNYTLVLTAYLILKSFPSKPSYNERLAKNPEHIIESNTVYFKAYEELREFLQASHLDHMTHIDLIESTRKFIRVKHNELVRDASKNWKIRNTLVSFHNNALRTSKYYTKSSMVQYKVEEFLKNVNSENMIQAAKKIVLDGKTIGAATGNKKEVTKKVTFKRASIYAKDSKRIGPNSSRFSSAKECTEYLMEVVGLKALQWGNSVPDNEREEHLRSLSFALYDLTRILEIEPKKISGSGLLSIAIGARGRSGALAHYEPNLNVINLTRKNGFGSLAHELGHFYDRKLGKMRGYLSESWDCDNESMRSLWKYFGELKDRIRDEKQFREFSQKKRQYWLSTHEVFARCFEVFCYGELVGNEELNNYLSGLDNHYLWPSLEEIEPMREHFKQLVKGL